MNIAAELQQIAILVDQYRLVSALVEVPDPAMAPVIGGGVTDIKMAHKLGQIAPRRGDEQMKVIAHQHIGVQLHLVIGQRTTQLVQKDGSVPIISVDRSPVVTAIANMIVTAWYRDP